MTATITDAQVKVGSNAKTGTVVDTLLKPPPRALLDVPLDRLIPNPGNHRDDLRDLTGMTASIESSGILEPLVVITLKVFVDANPTHGITDLPESFDDYYVILFGHRRHAGAQLAAGVETAPCIVRDDLAGPEGYANALIENMQREGINALEEAAGFAVLRSEPFKWSQERIAAAVGVSQPLVSKRLALQALPNSIRARITVDDNDGCITLEQAGEIARQPKTVQAEIADRIASERNPRSSEVADAIRTAVRDHDRSKAQQAALKKLRELDIPVINATGTDINTDQVTYSQDDGPCPINWLTAFDDDPAAHAALPCHAAVISGRQLSYAEDLEPEAQWISYVCTDPASHPEPDTDDAPAPVRELTPEQLEEQKQHEARRAKVERIRQANDRRGEYIRALVTGPKMPKEAAAYVVASNVTTMLGGYWDPDEIFHSVTGWADDDKIKALLVAAINGLEPNVAGAEALTRWALYLRLVHDDDDVRVYLAKQNPDLDCPVTTKFVARRTLAFLMFTGYQPGDEEKRILTDTTTAAEAAADYQIPGFIPTADDGTADIEPSQEDQQ